MGHYVAYVLTQGAVIRRILRHLRLPDDDRRHRVVITQLMCNFWVDLGTDAEERSGWELEQLARLEDDGLVQRRGTEVEVTTLGRLFVRNEAMVFDTYLRRAERVRFSNTV